MQRSCGRDVLGMFKEGKRALPGESMRLLLLLLLLLSVAGAGEEEGSTGAPLGPGKVVLPGLYNSRQALVGSFIREEKSFIRHGP